MEEMKFSLLLHRTTTVFVDSCTRSLQSSVESGSPAVAIGAVAVTVTPAVTTNKLSDAEIIIWWDGHNK
jgi:hypothetical protein